MFFIYSPAHPGHVLFTAPVGKQPTFPPFMPAEIPSHYGGVTVISLPSAHHYGGVTVISLPSAHHYGGVTVGSLASAHHYGGVTVISLPPPHHYGGVTVISLPPPHLAKHQLCEDAAGGPDVDVGRVVGGPEDQLGGPGGGQT